MPGIVIFFMVLMAAAATASGQPSDSRLAAAQQRMDAIVAALSDTLDTIEVLKGRMMMMGRANENYNEQKNIWLSSLLTLSAVACVCEYESELLTLFMDLREKNRRHYYNVRAQSLATSIQQLTIMSIQMQINHSLISHEPKELRLIEEEKEAVQSCIRLLGASLEVVHALQPK
jgi:hypothetical protein